MLQQNKMWTYPSMLKFSNILNLLLKIAQYCFFFIDTDAETLSITLRYQSDILFFTNCKKL